MTTDDLSGLFRPRPGPAAHFGQGTLLAWDPDTFENAVKWNGVELRNLTVLAGAEALTFAAGDQLTLVGWDSSGKRAAQEWAIWSRAIIPGTGAGERAIAFLRTELADAISADVFAARIHSVQDNDTGSRTSDAYGNLTGADVGPVVSGVNVTESGRALVITTAYMGATTAGANSIIGGWMAYDISGATTRSANDFNAASVTNLNAPASPYNPRHRISAMTLEDGLTAGAHTFTARYRSEDPAGASFSIRNLTAIAF